MKRLAVIIVFLSSIIASFDLNAAASVSIRLDRPKVDVSKAGGKDHPKRGRPSVENKTSTSEYSGKISCSGLGKDETQTIILEAYYITRSLSKNKNFDVIEKREVVDKFTFGGDNPPTQSFTLKSPPVTETETSELKGRRRNRTVVKTKSGQKYVGVVVRAVSSDKSILKVVTEPNNPNWTKRAKETTFRLD